jgi:hypothetical protein
MPAGTLSCRTEPVAAAASDRHGRRRQSVDDGREELGIAGKPAPGLRAGARSGVQRHGKGAGVRTRPCGGRDDQGVELVLGGARQQGQGAVGSRGQGVLGVTGGGVGVGDRQLVVLTAEVEAEPSQGAGEQHGRVSGDRVPEDRPQHRAAVRIDVHERHRLGRVAVDLAAQGSDVALGGRELRLTLGQGGRRCAQLSRVTPDALIELQQDGLQRRLGVGQRR